MDGKGVGADRASNDGREAGESGKGSIEAVHSASAPAAIGPYSQAVAGAGLLFVSGQLALLPQSGELRDGSIEEEAGQALANALAIVREAGLGPADVLKTTVFLTDLALYPQVNIVYEAAFEGWRPARSVVEVSRLPRGARIEVEMIAATRRPRGDEERNG
jgi:2-iminobutanoate/2-iminopropanoate deaminase